MVGEQMGLWGETIRPSLTKGPDARVVGSSARAIVYMVYANKIKMANMKTEPRTIARLAGSWGYRLHRFSVLRDTDWAGPE